MAALNHEALMRAIDITIDDVLRRTRGQSPDQQAQAMQQAMRELLQPPVRREPRQWDSADISYEPQED